MLELVLDRLEQYNRIASRPMADRNDNTIHSKHSDAIRRLESRL